MIHPKKSEEIINKCRTTLFGIVCLVIFLSSATGFGADTSKKVKVFILAGQSNMEGKAKVELLEYQINQPEMRDFFKHLKKDGRWVERDDVWINYVKHMANFICDVRKDLKVPDLPFVIGQMGQGGPEGASKRMQVIKEAQASMEAIPDFKGTVKVVKTDIFWDRKAAALVENWRDHVDEWNKVGSDYGYHYLGSAITFSKIGRTFGEAMLELMKVER